MEVERDRCRERERGRREKDRERGMILIFKFLRDDYLKLYCLYYFFKYF